MRHVRVFGLHTRMAALYILVDERQRLALGMELHAAFKVLRHSGQPLQPTVESRLKLSPRGHCHLYAPYRIERPQAAHYYDLSVQSGEQSWYELSPELPCRVLPGMHSHDDFGSVEFLEGVLYAIGYIRSYAYLSLNHYAGVVGHLRNMRQKAPPSLLIL